MLIGYSLAAPTACVQSSSYFDQENPLDTSKDLVWVADSGTIRFVTNDINDFIYVDDVAEGLVKIISKKIPSGIYNFGTGRSTSVIDIVRIIEKSISESDTTTEKMYDVALNQAMTKEIDFYANMDKTQKALNWRPVISLEGGIQKTINNF